ncbi:DUF1269 domain-containing protein [Jatrophihabitans sp. DSM 45814]
MSALTVWKFETADGAEKALATLEELQKQQLIQVLDGAIVTWPADKKKPKTQQLHNTTGAGALGGGFWGLLFGLIFFVPLIGLAIGAGMGALMGSMANVGIDEAFIDGVRNQITPGTSALFLMSQGAVEDKVRGAFQGTHPELIQTNLSDEQDAKLRAAFADD